LFEKINFELLLQAREAAGRAASPSAGVIDSQSVKTTESGGPRVEPVLGRGKAATRAAKKVKGRKRHIVTDTGGLLVGAEVHPADIQDRHGAVLVIEAIHQLFPWLRHLFADSLYNGANLRDALAKLGNWTVEIVQTGRGCCRLSTAATAMGCRTNSRLAQAGEPVGQQMRPGRDISGQKGAELAPVAAGSTAIRALPAKNPCWRFTAWPCLPFLFFGAGTFSTAATTRLLSGLAVLRPRLIGSPRPPMKVSSASRKRRSGRAGSSLSPWRNLCAMVQAVWYATASSCCRNLAETPALVAAHQIGGKKPLRQIRPRPMKQRSRRHRLLPVDPRSSLQPPSPPPAAA
jgi:transposase